TIRRLKPWPYASSSSVTPCGLLASSSKARRCSELKRRFRGTDAIRNHEPSFSPLHLFITLGEGRLCVAERVSYANIRRWCRVGLQAPDPFHLPRESAAYNAGRPWFHPRSRRHLHPRRSGRAPQCGRGIPEMRTDREPHQECVMGFRAKGTYVAPSVCR